MPMLRVSLMLFLVYLLLPGLAQESPEAIVAAVREAYAPDRRVALFDVALKRQGRRVDLMGETNLPQALEALEERLVGAGYEPSLAIELLPDAGALDGRTRAVVRLSACNIRSRPAHSAELSTQSTLGTPLRVLKAEGDWYLVQTPDRYLGWLDAGGLELMDPAALDAWLQAERVVYLPDFGLAYQGPSTEHMPVSDLLAGNILRHLGTEAGWVKVGYPDGREGFVPEAAVQPYDAWLATRESDAKAILRTARTFLGRPYLWGGTSGKGVDCSGFTKTVLYLHGLLLPRDASQQVHVGYAVDTDKTWAGLLPGDLLFFGRPASGEQPERIVHVAIYQGGGRIIHAAGTVKEDSLVPGDPDFNAKRYDTFVRARRVLDRPERHGVPPLRTVDLYRSSGG